MSEQIGPYFGDSRLNPSVPGTPGSLVGKKGWSSFSNLLVGSNDTSVVLQANFEHVGYYTIQFSQFFPPDLIDTDHAVATLAEIKWLVEGNYVQRLVSVQNGVAVSGTGQAVEVRVYDWSIQGASPPLEYGVDIQVTPGTRPSLPGYQPMLLVDSTVSPFERGAGDVDIAAGADETFFIPENAGINSCLILMPDVNPPLDNYEVTIWFLAQGFGIVGRLSYNSCNRWVPIPPTATQIFIRNDTNPPRIIQGINVIYGVEG